MVIDGTLVQVMINDLCILLNRAETTPALRNSISSFNPYTVLLCDHTARERYISVIRNLVGFY